MQLRILNIFLDEGDAQDFDFPPRAAAGGHGHAGVEHDVEFFEYLRGLIGRFFLLEADPKHLMSLFADGCTFFGAGLAETVHTQDVF